MLQDDAWDRWNDTWSSPGTGVPVRPPVDPVHDYATRLNQVVARAREGDAAEAARAEAALARVGAHGLDPALAARHFERRRRELLDQLGVTASAFLTPPAGGGADGWLRFFLLAAELAGAPGASVVAADGTETLVRPERPVPPPPGALRELHCLGPRAGATAALDVGNGLLTLSGPPWWYFEVLRGLDAMSGAAPLHCRLRYDRIQETPEGSAVAASFVLENRSRDYLVLESLATDGACERGQVFSVASGGRLRALEGLDAYVVAGPALGRADAAGPPFHQAVIPPGGRFTAHTTLRFLGAGDAWRHVRVSYRRYTPDLFAQDVYVPRPVRGFPPEVRYQPLGAPGEPASDLSRVVLREGGPPPREMGWSFLFHIGRRAFSLDDAIARVEGARGGVHFSRWQQAWVIRVAEGAAIVTPRLVKRMAGVDPEVFPLVDELDHRVPLRFDEPLLPEFQRLPIGVTDWEGHPLGLSVTMPKYKLGGFIEVLTARRCGLGLTRNGLGRPSLWVFAHS